MKKQVLRITILSVLVLLITSSCEKFLKEEYVSGIGFSYYDSESGIEDLVKSAYVPLRAWGGTQEGLKLSNHGTDIWEYTNVSDGNEFHMYTSSLNPSNGNFYSIWGAFYQGISRCNIAISRIPKIEDVMDVLSTESGKNQRMGEVKFLRGYYYFMLVQMFGKIPLLIEENIGVMTEMSRAEVSDIYGAIISDLRFAAKYLPETQDQKARPTRSAAQHLLAKVYLTRGSAVSEERGQKSTDMDSAAYYADKVIEYKGELLDDFNDARRVDNEDNKENLFSVQYTSNKLYDGLGNRMHLFYTMQYMTVGGLGLSLDYGEAWVRLRPTDYLYDLFELKYDSRFYKSFKTIYFCNLESTIPKWTSNNAPSVDLVGQSKFGIGDTALLFSMNVNAKDSEIESKSYTWRPRNKFTNRVFPCYQYHLDPFRTAATDKYGTLDFKLMWLSETYLIAAEAYGRQGNYSKAVDYINVVRRRAAYKEGEAKPFQYVLDGGEPSELTSSAVTDMEISEDQINSLDKLRDFILEERARELCGDNERWFDLVRTETFFDRVVKYNKECSNAVRPYHKLRPIPQNHIDRLTNVGTIQEEQNEGYY
ncbi:RagB/SusD family nutrient uptake outer membrane protein [Mariniphaga sediminis]|uniref:RagB/SusD family nutrient uptake outer membrane protein n=1 Tax=Mariniphaga sediminis TaxID=1628158 RepID=A0A399D6G8_9BACT|nr:RagB/SusD family nutrient uptake outer membrane protein [Mariniphaga sediminis]RIH67086.1 RagB/SusD family nutrient uptake outer membrane protein [Mariniphaga sediminis]